MASGANSSSDNARTLFKSLESRGVTWLFVGGGSDGMPNTHAVIACLDMISRFVFIQHGKPLLYMNVGCKQDTKTRLFYPKLAPR